MTAQRERIVVSEDGLSLPVIEVLTGRGVIFGKSGSGKSNSASVIVEELLEKGFPLLIVDIEGEYFTMRDRYDVVHVGDGDQYDHQLFETESEQIVDFCLDQNRPVIIDISDVLEIDRAHKIIENTLTVLFSREKRVQQPFLVIVEEIHEFLPQQGGLDDLGETLIRIAKRGRKRGLGLVGMSQRPASVDKDFITQCDWLVWHRLTWENDTRVVKSILGSDTAKEVQELDTGEAIMMTDWDETVRRVKFRRKRTADAGDTPSLSPADRRDLTNPASSSSSGATSSSSSASSSKSKSSPSDSPATDPSSSESSPSNQSAQSTESTPKTDPASAGSDSPSQTANSSSRDPDSTSSSDRPTTSASAAGAETYGESTVEPADDDTENALVKAFPSTLEEAERRVEDEPGPDADGAVTLADDAEPVPDDGSNGQAEMGESPPSDPVIALWELGQLVTFVLVKFLNSLVYGSRLAFAKATGKNEPVDRLGPVSQPQMNSRPDPSRAAVWIVGTLLTLLVSLFVLAVVLF